MTERERMVSGLTYNPKDEELIKETEITFRKLKEFNDITERYSDRGKEIIKNLFGKTGERVSIIPPFRCDYGFNIKVGEDFFANYNCTFLDGGGITIGDNCFIAPNVGLFTVAHPIDPEMRVSGPEFASPIKIGNRVWICGGSIVNPGVTIGDNVVIGSGSVVTKDIPSNCVAAGNPATVIRPISEKDKIYYFKDKKY